MVNVLLRNDEPPNQPPIDGGGGGSGVTIASNESPLPLRWGDVNPDAPVFVPRPPDATNGSQSGSQKPTGEGQVPPMSVPSVPETPELSPYPLGRFLRTSIAGVTGPPTCDAMTTNGPTNYSTTYPMVTSQQYIEATPGNCATTAYAGMPVVAPVVTMPAMNQPVAHPIPVRTMGNGGGMNQPLVNQPMMNIPITQNIAMNTVPASCYNPPSCLPLSSASAFQPPVYQPSSFPPSSNVPPSVPPPVPPSVPLSIVPPPVPSAPIPTFAYQ